MCFGAAVASRSVPSQPNENLPLAAAAAKELRVSLITIMKASPEGLVDDDDEDDEEEEVN